MLYRARAPRNPREVLETLAAMLLLIDYEKACAMTDSNTKTPNLSLQHIGIQKTIEPADYNAMLDAIDSNLPAPPIVAASYGTAGTGVAGTNAANVQLQKLRLTLTNALVPLTDALKYGSLQIFLWPNSNIRVMAARVNLTAVKDGTGTTAASTPSVGVGSVAASASTLATTAIDTVEQVALAGTLSATYQKNGPHTLGARDIAAGVTNKLFLNASNSGSSSSADGTLTVSGTIDVFFYDWGTFG